MVVDRERNRWQTQRNSITGYRHSSPRVKGGGGKREVLRARLVVCHCFSERLIKARKYGAAMPVEQRGCLELMTGDTVRVGRVGSGGPRGRVVRYRDEDQRGHRSSCK